MNDSDVHTSKMSSDINSLFDIGLERELTIYPSSSNTASQLGIGCDRRLVFAQTRGTESQKPSVNLQKIYDYGNLIGDYVQTRLRKDGFTVLENQRAFRDRSLNLSAKIDCMIKHERLGNRAVLCEIKSFSPFEFDKYNKAEDFLQSNKHYYRSYYTQLQTYLYLLSLERQEFEEWGLLLLFNKNTASLKGIVFKRDDQHIEESVLKRCERINYYVKNNLLPEAEYCESACPECPFNHICDVGNVCNADELKESDTFLVDEFDLVEAIKRKEELKESYKQYMEADDFIKWTMKMYKEDKGKSHFLLGSYDVRIKTISHKKYKVPDEIKKQYEVVSSYDKILIKKLENDEMKKRTNKEVNTEVTKKEPSDEDIAIIQKELDKKKKLIDDILSYREYFYTELSESEIISELIMKDDEELKTILLGAKYSFGKREKEDVKE